MSASFKKFFRESHRETRLRHMRLGENWHHEVRSLRLTPKPVKVLNIKDSSNKYDPERSPK